MDNQKSKLGKAISPEERKNRTLKHLILYGLKMMVRRDIGGATSIKDHAKFIKSEFDKEMQINLDHTILAYEFVGKTANEAAILTTHVVDDALARIASVAERMINDQINGVKERQKRTIEEIEARAEKLSEEMFEASKCIGYVKIKEGLSDEEKASMLLKALEKLNYAVSTVIDGESTGPIPIDFVLE